MPFWNQAMSEYIYFCSKKIFKQFNLIPESLSFHNHAVVKKDNFSFIYPEDNSSNTINPKNYYSIKKQLGFSRLIIVDQTYHKINIVNVADHINRTGKSYLRGKTPFKKLPTFPDISNIYHEENGKTLMSVGEKNTLNINTQENVILSSWIAAISPVWHYVGVKIVGLGVTKNISSINKIIKFIK